MLTQNVKTLAKMHVVNTLGLNKRP